MSELTREQIEAIRWTLHGRMHDADVDAVCDLAKEALDRREGWRPIETAPKDGSVVLGAVNGNALRVCWIEHYGAWYCQEVGEDKEPTHWLPLPTPPAAACHPDCVDGELYGAPRWPMDNGSQGKCPNPIHGVNGGDK